MGTASKMTLEERKALLAEVVLTANLEPHESPFDKNQHVHRIHLVDPVTRSYIHSTYASTMPPHEVKVPVFTARNTSPSWGGEDYTLPSAGGTPIYEYCSFRPLVPEIPNCQWWVYTEGPRYWDH